MDGIFLNSDLGGAKEANKRSFQRAASEITENDGNSYKGLTTNITRIRDTNNISILLPLSEWEYLIVVMVPPRYSKYVENRIYPFGSWAARPVGATSRPDIALLKSLVLENKTVCRGLGAASIEKGVTVFHL